MHTGRLYHTATLLANGQVLVAGGNGSGGSYLTSAELYDPAGGTWTATNSMHTARINHTATLLPNGQVLAQGASTMAVIYPARSYTIRPPGRGQRLPAR